MLAFTEDKMSESAKQLKKEKKASGGAAPAPGAAKQKKESGNASEYPLLVS